MADKDCKESELERELESLYYRVASLDQPDDIKKRGDDLTPFLAQSLKSQMEAPQGAAPHEPAQKRPSPETGRRKSQFTNIIKMAALVAFLLFSLIAVKPPEEKKRENQAQIEVPPITATTTTTIKGEYAVQIKSFSEQEKKEAIAFVGDVVRKKSDVHVERVDIEGSGIWYRILLGYFESKDEAFDYMKGNEILSDYPDSFVQRMSSR